MLKLFCIILISSIIISNSFAQRSLDSGGRGTESTIKDRINRIKNDSRNNPKTIKVKDPKSYFPNNSRKPEPPHEVSFCGGTSYPRADVVICTDNSPDVYNEMDIDSDQSLIDSGLQQFDEGNYYGAISTFDEGININPNKKELYFWRGRALVAVSEFEKAIKDFSTAIIFDNDYMEAYYQRGLAHFYLGNRRKSKEDLNFAYSLGYSRAGSILNKYF